MDSKKLLHVLYSGQGGLGTYFMNFVNSDHEAHFEHYAFFYGIEPLNQELATFCEEKNIPYCYQQKQGKVDLKGVKAVLKFRKTHQIPFILLHTFSLSLLTLISLLKRCKVIAIDHTTLSFKTMVEKLFTIINHLCSYKMIYFYEGHFENVKRIFPFLKFGKNSHIIPKTVDINFFKPTTQKLENKAFALGITSRLVEGKRHDLILQALAILKSKGIDINLRIAGNGQNEPYLKRLTEDLKLTDDVDFVGLLDKIELLKFYQSLDAYIHASAGETICYSIMEAQACGLPILASDVEGISNEMKDNVNALLFSNTPNSIVDKTLLIQNDFRLQNSMKEIGRASMKQSFLINNNPNLLYNILTNA